MSHFEARFKFTSPIHVNFLEWFNGNQQQRSEIVLTRIRAQDLRKSGFTGLQDTNLEFFNLLLRSHSLNIPMARVANCRERRLA